MCAQALERVGPSHRNYDRRTARLLGMGTGRCVDLICGRSSCVLADGASGTNHQWPEILAGTFERPARLGYRNIDRCNGLAAFIQNCGGYVDVRSEEHTSELQSLM